MFARAPALATNELPFFGAYLLLASTALALAQGDLVADALAAIQWVRSHAQEYGGDPARIFLVGSSAGAYLAVDAVNARASGIAGVVGRYGYYGSLRPLLAIHGENDLLVPAVRAREFVERMRARSSHPARYGELPGGHHDFDLYESIRSNAVSIAVERFITAAEPC